MHKIVLAAVGVLATVAAVGVIAQDTLQEIATEGEARIEEGQRAQAKVDAVYETSRNLVEDYRAQLKLVEGLEEYIDMLDDQLLGQQQEISTLQQSIGDVAVIERQILPLMSRMIDSLAALIELDVPFLMEERRERVAKLRELLRRSDFTVAEKTRRVFEAYQVENDYGRTIEAYTAKVALGGASFDAEFLRVGRVGLMYRTIGNERLGFWDADTSSWRALDGVPYKRLIEKGLKVARQEIAPELVSIPLDLAQVETR